MPGDSVHLDVRTFDQHDKVLAPESGQRLALSTKLGKLSDDGTFTAGKKVGAEIATGKLAGLEINLPITVCNARRLKAGTGKLHDFVTWASGTSRMKSRPGHVDGRVLKLPVSFQCRGVTEPILSLQTISLTVLGAQLRPIGVALTKPDVAEIAYDFGAMKNKIGRIDRGRGNERLSFYFGVDRNVGIGWGVGSSFASLVFLVPKQSKGGTLKMASAKQVSVTWK